VRDGALCIALRRIQVTLDQATRGGERGLDSLSHLPAAINTLAYPQSALFGSYLALVADLYIIMNTYKIGVCGKGV
jgi:hypothetical protein